LPTFFGPSGAGGDSFESFLARLMQSQGQARRPIDITRLLTRRTHALLEVAGRFAAEHGHAELDVLHLVRVMMDHDQIGRHVAATGADPQAIAQAAESRMPEPAEGAAESSEDQAAAQVSLTAATQRALLDAYQVARSFGSTYIEPEHVFFALVLNQDLSAGQLFAQAGVTPQTLHQVAAEQAARQASAPAGGTAGGASAAGSAEGAPGASETPVLDQYGLDLTALAREGRLDPVIGRAQEIEQTVEILARRTKNNPVLIGEAGVGKTAVVEGLAQAIVADEVPAQLLGKRVISLDLPAMLAGTRYRGDFEERLTKAIEEIAASEGEVIAFIDELHTVLGAGGSGEGMDAGNILKPRLARGDLHLVGATTLSEFRRVEKDQALARRFQQVTVDEPSQEDAVRILAGVKDRYEEHHGVRFTDEAVRAAVEMSSRYITDRFLPDKAIDLLDQAGARMSLRRGPSRELLELREKRAQLDAAKSAAVAAESFEEAARLRDEIEEVDRRIAAAEGSTAQRDAAAQRDTAAQDVSAASGAPEGAAAQGSTASGVSEAAAAGEANQIVDEHQIAEIVARSTGIPVARLTEGERDRLARLEDELHEQVIGQSDAVSAVARAVRRSRAGMSDESRPVGSFLFLGPTGVGKTELARALAASLFGDEKAMIRFDMSEFGERHTASRLVGAPPGYVGFDEAGQLTERVRRRPYSVILLDEIEKAHPDVFNLLLQVLDDGRLTDGQGRTVDFRNTVVIMTSNIGAEFLTSSIGTIGFSAESQSAPAGGADGHAANAVDAGVRSRVMSRLRETMRPEFLNRIDDIVLFGKLDRAQLRRIVQLQLGDTERRLRAQGFELEVAEDALDWFADRGFEPEYGARPLRRVLQHELDDRIADLVLSSALTAGARVTVAAPDGELRVAVEEPVRELEAPAAH
jgi:ATP-dependent Clp protease ATP-binding subunit ClpC